MVKIERRGGRWSFRYRDEFGQRKRSKSYQRHGDAKAAMATILARVARAREGHGDEDREERDGPARGSGRGSVTFAELIPDFVKAVEADPERRAKVELRHRVEGRVASFFGPLLVAAVGEREIEQFRKGLVAAKLSPQSVCHFINTLALLFKYAVQEGHRRQAPVLKRPKIPKRPYNYLREEEIAPFLLAAREVGAEVGAAAESRRTKALRRGDDGFGFYLLFRFAIDTGLRKGEIACLKWVDVDLEREVVTVSRSFNGPTKSGEPRVVPLGLAPGLIEELKAWRQRNTSDLVFPSIDGQRMAPSARIFAEHFAKVRDRAGIKPRMALGQEKVLNFHALRHTFATRYMAAPDASPWRLKKYLGHASITTTERYAHADEDAARKDRGIFARQSGALEPDGQ